MLWQEVPVEVGSGTFPHWTMFLENCGEKQGCWVGDLYSLDAMLKAYAALFRALGTRGPFTLARTLLARL